MFIHVVRGVVFVLFAAFWLLNLVAGFSVMALGKPDLALIGFLAMIVIAVFSGLIMSSLWHSWFP